MLARWLSILDTYDFEIQYRAGSKHSNADAMSRSPRLKCSNENCADCCLGKSTENTEKQILCPIIRNNESSVIENRIEPNWLQIWTHDELVEMQSEDQSIGPIRQLVKNFQIRPPKRESQNLNVEAKILWTQWNSLEIVNDLLYRRIENQAGEIVLQLIAPQAIRNHIFKELHENRTAGHFGRDRTLANIRRRFYWPSMSESVKRWCVSCDLCARAKPGPGLGRSALTPFQIKMPLECVAIEICGPLPATRDGNEYIIVLADYFTKWQEAFAVPNHTALTVAEFFCRFGCPIQLHSDQGREFESELFSNSLP